jgi:hypothetical protein
MTWTMTNLMIEIIAGIVGAHTVAMAVREYSFGALGHSMVGAIGGCVSSYFLNALSAMVVNGSEALNEPRLLDQIVAHSLTAAATGGILMLIVGFVKPAIFATTDERPEVDVGQEVRWWRSPIVPETTSNSSHQRLKLPSRAASAARHATTPTPL